MLGKSIKYKFKQKIDQFHGYTYMSNLHVDLNEKIIDELKMDISMLFFDLNDVQPISEIIHRAIKRQIWK